MAPEHERELDDLTRDELNDLAAEEGVQDPGKLPGKKAVIAAIEQYRAAAGGPPPEPDVVPDDAPPAGRPPLGQLAEERARQHQNQNAQKEG